MLQIFFENPAAIIGILFGLCAFAFTLGRFSKSAKKTTLVTEGDVEEMAMEEIRSLFWRQETSDKAFGEDCERIREEYRGIMQRLQKKRAMDISKLSKK